MDRRTIGTTYENDGTVNFFYHAFRMKGARAFKGMVSFGS